MSERIAKPSPDAPLYRKGQVTHLPAAAKLAATAAGKAATAAQRRAATAPTAAAMPAQPAVNAWQRPLTAAVQFEGALPPLPPPPPPPPPKHMAVGGLQASLAAGAVTVLEQPLLKMELPPSQQQHSDTPLLSLGLAASIVTGGGGGGGAGAGDGLGWSLIGSAFDLGRGRGGGSHGSGFATPAAALASADSSRAATPAPSASSDMLGGGGGLYSLSGGDGGMYSFHAATSGAGSLQGGVGGHLGEGSGDGHLVHHQQLSATTPQHGRPWEQHVGGRNGGQGPTGNESAFLSQLMQGGCAVCVLQHILVCDYGSP